MNGWQNIWVDVKLTVGKGSTSHGSYFMTLHVRQELQVNNSSWLRLRLQTRLLKATWMFCSI